MSKECDIVKDLLINYVENNLRDGSKMFVKEHLKECKECTDYLKIVEEDVKFVDTVNDEKEINFFKKVNEKIKSKSKIVKILIICLCLIIFINIGIFINYQIYMDNAGMEIFLEDNISQENKDIIKEYIENAEIKEYSFKSKEEALEKMKESLGDNANVLDGYSEDTNIFPESFVVTAEKKVIESLSDELNGINGIKKINTQISYNPYEVLLIKLMGK